VFAGLSLDSAFGKASKHKTASENNGDVDVRSDMMMNNGLVFEGDTHQQKREKLKPL